MSQHDTPPALPSRDDGFPVEPVRRSGDGERLARSIARRHGRTGVGSEPCAGSASRRVSPVVAPPTAAT